MKILVIDRDELTAGFIRSRLEPVGHQITYIQNKSEIVDSITRQDSDIVFIDPSPVLNPKSLIVNIRRQIRYYPYIILMSDSFGFADALSFGLNDVLPKPVELNDIDRKVENGIRLLNIIRHMNDESEDFPSAGGVISKSAFNQLFFSCIDRADRYGERSFALFITMRNYKALAAQFGQSEADIATAKMAQHLVRLRRASDIIGQTRVFEYALLLLRPTYQTEPMDAANRFAEALSRCTDIPSVSGMEVELTISLIDLPAGDLLAEHTLNLRR